MDNKTPGNVYLCQVSENISCGACCGLYNISDPSYKNLYNILRYRTILYKKTEKNYESILQFKEKIRSIELTKNKYSDFHHCPYIGLIRNKKDCVGCLLHPLAEGNNGIDFRGLSYYGGMACRSYFCSTCHHLDPEYKKILRISVKNWHLYGLIITETNMLDHFFKTIEDISQKKLTLTIFEKSSELQNHVLSFLKLKLSWKFRDIKTYHPCNYFFEENIYPSNPVDYKKTKKATSIHDPIFQAFGSIFETQSDLENAEKIIQDLIYKICECL